MSEIRHIEVRWETRHWEPVLQTCLLLGSSQHALWLWIQDAALDEGFGTGRRAGLPRVPREGCRRWRHRCVQCTGVCSALGEHEGGYRLKGDLLAPGGLSGPCQVERTKWADRCSETWKSADGARRLQSEGAQSREALGLGCEAGTEAELHVVMRTVSPQCMTVGKPSTVPAAVQMFLVCVCSWEMGAQTHVAELGGEGSAQNTGGLASAWWP